MQMTHQVTLPVAGHAVAQDEVVHASADIDRVDLDIAVVAEGGAEAGGRGVQQQGAAHEAAGDDGRDF